MLSKEVGIIKVINQAEADSGLDMIVDRSVMLPFIITNIIISVTGIKLRVSMILDKLSEPHPSP